MNPLTSKLRRLFRFRLLTLLVLVTICAVWLGKVSYEAKRQGVAVEALRELGMRVYYDYNRPRPSRRSPPAEVPWGPTWLRKSIGDDYFQDVVTIRGYGQTRVNDADMVHFDSLPDLEELYFFYTDITDDGLQHLSGCGKLQRLELAQVAVTDDGLFHISNLKSLNRLRLSANEITDSGLKHLSKLDNLYRLELAHNRIWGEGFVHLRQLKRLQTIELLDVPVTDAGLSQLENLPNLRRLQLERTRVTDDGVAELQAALPNCRIER